MLHATSSAPKHATPHSLRPQANVLQCMSLQFACLVTFSWMRCERAIERLWSGFHEPETSHAHTEMLWNGDFHESTVERSVARTFFLAFTLLLILLVMQRSMGEVHAPKKSYACHPRFPTHFSGHNALISQGWRISMH